MTAAGSMFSLDGRTALVTGASRGLGQAIAVALADEAESAAGHIDILVNNAGATRRTSPEPQYFLRLPQATTRTATCLSSMASGWRADSN